MTGVSSGAGTGIDASKLKSIVGNCIHKYNNLSAGMIIRKVHILNISFTFQEYDKRKRQAEMAPRRVSARITMKMREFQEQVFIVM